MSDTPSSDTPSDIPSEPDEPETVVDLADDGQAGDGKAGDVAPWKLVAVIAAVVVVVVGGLAAYHYRGKIFKSSNTKTTTAQGPKGTDPVDRIEDDFNRDDNTNIGSVGGQAWNQVVGKWGVKNHQAYVVEPNPKGPRNFTVVDLHSGDGFVQAKAAKLATSWSLLFRYESPNAYWRLWWDQEHKGLHLSKFVDNKETQAIPGGFIAPNAHEGMQLRVEFQGPTITVFVDDTPVRTVSDPYLKDQTKVGMYVEKDGAADARWENFVASSTLPQPVRTAPNRGTGSGATTP
jgi:hypothetical protein